MTLETLELLNTFSSGSTKTSTRRQSLPKSSGGRGFGAAALRITAAIAGWAKARRAHGTAAPGSTASERKPVLDATDSVSETGSQPRTACRRCGIQGTRRLCAACATEGFIELRCGCIERPDGTRDSCDVSVHIADPRPMANGHCYSPAIYAAFGAWVDAASEAANDRRAVNTNSTDWRERAWSLR